MQTPSIEIIPRPNSEGIHVRIGATVASFSRPLNPAQRWGFWVWRGGDESADPTIPETDVYAAGQTVLTDEEVGCMIGVLCDAGREPTAKDIRRAVRFMHGVPA